jgi:hypothetical protein
LEVVAYKNRNADLRKLLKIFKLRFDDLYTLRRYEPALRRLLFLSSGPENQAWHGDGLHQLALFYERSGDISGAFKYYALLEDYDATVTYEPLRSARWRRDHGLLIALHRDLEEGLLEVKRALALHEEDLVKAKTKQQRQKGLRQQRITESYLWRARLLVDHRDKAALGSLTEFALVNCLDCCLRDQQQAIEFVAPYTKGAQRQLLDARLIEVHARRLKPTGVVLSMARFVIDAELMVAGKIVRTMFRKE